MRSILIIYVAAGITLLGAAFGSAAYLGHAYATQRAITVLKPQGNELAGRQAVYSHELHSAGAALILALLMVAVLVSARNLQRQVGLDVSRQLKIVVAVPLGLISFALFMNLAEDIRVVPEKDPTAVFINGGIVLVVMAAYFFICEYLLSRRNPQAVWKHWPTILALTSTLIVTPVLVIASGETMENVMQAAGLAIFAVVFSCAGAALAARAARHRNPPTLSA